MTPLLAHAVGIGGSGACMSYRGGMGGAVVVLLGRSGAVLGVAPPPPPPPHHPPPPLGEGAQIPLRPITPGGGRLGGGAWGGLSLCCRLAAELF